MTSEKYDLNECRKKIATVLGVEQKEKYFQLVRSWWLFKKPSSKVEFDTAVRTILRTKEQLRAHNSFMLATMKRKHMSGARNPARSSCTVERCSFMPMDITAHVPTPNKQALPEHFAETSTSEFFPNITLIRNRVDFHAWENGLDGCEEAVSEYVAHLCQWFVKNILTAMLTRLTSYKIRERHFQYGFGLPAANSLLRNAHNIADTSQTPNVTVSEEEGCFMPSMKPSIDVVEQETAFAYACSRRSQTDNKLTLQLLYDTLRSNPQIVALHSIHSTNLLKLGLQLDSDCS